MDIQILDDSEEFEEPVRDVSNQTSINHPLTPSVNPPVSSLGLLADNDIISDAKVEDTKTEQVPQSSPVDKDVKYDGDVIDNSPPLKESGWQVMQFPSPALLVSFFDKDIREGHVTLHSWQVETTEELANAKPTAQSPYKFCLRAANGSGKDKFVIAPFVIWFLLCKIRSRCIVTSSSGTQLTAQTESYIKDLADKVNQFFGQEIFKIRQRFIRCLLSGSEVRMFATDEKGKAEGYHPIDANSEMAIIVNEGKSVTEDIHSALQRCTGYNYWLEISTPGEPTGFFYESSKWEHNRVVTCYDCPHLSMSEIEAEKISLGEHSALFRSKNLAEFTSISGSVIITSELVDIILKNHPPLEFQDWPLRYGIDLAAGCAETVLCVTRGNRFVVEHAFQETDSTITAFQLDRLLNLEKATKDCQLIFADDGGIGKAIIDILVSTYKWNVNRVLNQTAALGNKKQFGNRGAENWYRIQRILEERCFNLDGMSKKTITQLTTRRYKQSMGGSRIFLESKPDAIAHGRPSPDRADAFILSLSGLTIEDFLKSDKLKKASEEKAAQRIPNAIIHQVYEEKKFAVFGENEKLRQSKRIFSSLRSAINN